MARQTLVLALTLAACQAPGPMAPPVYPGQTRSIPVAGADIAMAVANLPTPRGPLAGGAAPHIGTAGQIMTSANPYRVGQSVAETQALYGIQQAGGTPSLAAAIILRRLLGW